MFRNLSRTGPTQVLLFTDLHAGNVHLGERSPWLLIDPKPYVGDPHHGRQRPQSEYHRRWDCQVQHDSGRCRVEPRQFRWTASDVQRTGCRASGHGRHRGPRALLRRSGIVCRPVAQRMDVKSVAFPVRIVQELRTKPDSDRPFRLAHTDASVLDRFARLTMPGRRSTLTQLTAIDRPWSRSLGFLDGPG
jgi:hypothetical protein